MRGTWLLGLALAGCGTENGFKTDPEDGGPPATDTGGPDTTTTTTPSDPPTGTDPSTGTGSGATPPDNDDYDAPPDLVAPPSDTRDACGSGVYATMTDPEIWVGASSSSSRLETTTIVAPVAGWFDLYNTHIVESGDRQWNESAYFRVTNATNPDGYPLLANCVDDWVVVDLDNAGPPPGTRVYIGTFWLDVGDNTLEMRHYCDRYLAGECTSLHIPDDPNSTCDSGNINSVHFYGDGICLELPGY